MIFNVEVGELHVRTADGRVYLVVHDENRQSVMFSLSPLAAHNLGLVLPDYTREAAIANLARIEGSIYP